MIITLHRIGLTLSLSLILILILILTSSGDRLQDGSVRGESRGPGRSSHLPPSSGGGGRPDQGQGPGGTCHPSRPQGDLTENMDV